MKIEIRRPARTPVIIGAVAGLAIAVTAAGVGLAQGDPRPPRPEGMHGERREALKEHRDERRAVMAKRLHDALQLRPDQEGAWRDFQAALPQPGDRPKMERPPGEMTTPQRLDHMAARMAEGQARFQKMADATKRFYAALSPPQQKTFDALAMMRGHGGRGGPDRGGPPGPGFPDMPPPPPLPPRG